MWRGKYLWADLPFPYCANLYHDCFSSLSSSWVRNISRWIKNMLAAILVFLIYIPVHYTLKPNPRVCCSGIWWTSGLFSRTFLLFLRFPEIHIPQQLQSLALPALYGDRLRAWQGSFTWAPLPGRLCWMLVGFKMMQPRPRESRGRFSLRSSELGGVWLMLYCFVLSL